MKKSIFFLIAVMLLGFGSSVYAEDSIDLEDGSGDNLNGGKIINEENIYPGWSKSEKVIIQNNSTDSEVDLYIKFKKVDGNTLADQLKVYVIRDDGSYRLGGSGDKYTLKEAYNAGSLFLGKLDTEEREKYKIKLKFDRDAGNEFQGLSTKFDIDFKIEGEASAGASEQSILASQGRVVSGATPADEATPVVAQAQEDEGNVPVVALNTAGDENGQVAGAEICRSWPWWAWVLLVVLLGGGAYAVGRNMVEYEKRERRNRLFGQLGLTAILLIFWYFFETCHVQLWVPIVTLLVGGGIAIATHKMRIGGEEV